MSARALSAACNVVRSVDSAASTSLLPFAWICLFQLLRARVQMSEGKARALLALFAISMAFTATATFWELDNTIIQEGVCESFGGTAVISNGSSLKFYGRHRPKFDFSKACVVPSVQAWNPDVCLNLKYPLPPSSFPEMSVVVTLESPPMLTFYTGLDCKGGGGGSSEMTACVSALKPYQFTFLFNATARTIATWNFGGGDCKFFEPTVVKLEKVISTVFRTVAPVPATSSCGGTFNKVTLVKP